MLIAPWLVLALGLLTTSWLTISAYRAMTERDADLFNRDVDDLVARFETRLRTYGQALMGMRDWYSAHPTMTETLWTNYVFTMHAPLHYPGLFQVGFAEHVRDTSPPPDFPQLKSHLSRMRKRLGPHYNLHLPPGGVEGYSWYHMPVIWHSYCLWRRDVPRAYLHYGVDLNQNPDLWAAMNWALGDDRPAFSGKQSLDPDGPGTEGLLIFLPVYRSDLNRELTITLLESETNHVTTAQQVEEVKWHRHYSHFLRGLVFGGIDIQTFLKDHLGTNAPEVTFGLYISTNQLPSQSPEQLLFDNRETNVTPAIASRAAKRSIKIAPHQVDLPLYGRVFRFVCVPGPAFNSALNLRTLGTAASFGVATTLLLAVFIAYQSRANRKERATAAALRRSEAQLQTLLHERERMSCDLHDGTIQSLYAIGLGLGQLRRTLHGAPERDRLDASLVELDHVVAELRGYLMRLDPGVSPAQSTAAALSELVARLRQTAAAEVRFAAEPGAGENWPPAAVLDLLLAAREGISNALRHGHPAQVELSLQGTGSNARLTIEDDGQGFDQPVAQGGFGRGLTNLERRARAWNGSLKVESRPGGPTRLTLALSPLEGHAPPYARLDEDNHAPNPSSAANPNEQSS